MLVRLKNKTYKGISDGTSLTDERCKQILSVYHHTKDLGDKLMTYKDLQNEVSNSNLFGGITIGDSAIRTIFPLLSKIGLVNYSNQFRANKLFTNLGVVFMETYEALYINKEYSCDDLQKELELCLSLIQRYGLLIMNEQPEFQNHGFWLVLSILKAENEIYWSEFLYILYLIKETGLDLDAALVEAKNNRATSTTYDYVNESGNAIANTSYSYLHAYLLEAKIIEDKDSKCSQLRPSMLSFINELNLNYE